jgi:hypothetical protein
MTFNDILKNKDASAEAKLQDLINLVAVCPILCNLAVSTSSKYI